MPLPESSAPSIAGSDAAGRSGGTEGSPAKAAELGKEGSSYESLSRPTPTFKLEIVTSKETWVMRCLLYGFMLAFLVPTIVAWALYGDNLISVGGDVGSKLTVTNAMQLASRTFFCLVILASAGVYAGHFHCTAVRPRPHQMSWVFGLQFSALVYLLPVYSSRFFVKGGSDRLPATDTYAGLAQFVITAYGEETVWPTLSRAMFFSGTMVCFWAWADSFVAERPFGYDFYAMKLAAVVMIFVFRIVMYVGPRIEVGEFPTSSIFGLISLRVNTAAEYFPTPSLVFMSFNIIFESMIVAWIFYVMTYVTKKLRKRSYLKNRSIINSYICFRSVVVQFAVASTIILTISPWIYSQHRYFLLESTGLMVLSSEAGTSLVFHSFVGIGVVVISYFFLPADMTGLWHFRERMSEEDLLSEQFEFNVKEFITPSGQPSVNRNHFSLATNVLLLNFSWLVYQHQEAANDDAIDPVKLEAYNEMKMKVSRHVQDRETDTHAILCESDERLIVSFRGTSSTQNMETDLSMRMVHISKLIKDYPTSTPAIAGAWKSTRIHRGFLKAYASVNEEIMQWIFERREESARPIFFTGHSLGAALTTLAAFDFCVRYPEHAEAVSVTTFGSPRVGNEGFKYFYNKTVPSTWRFVNCKDPITMLPSLPYRHVGQCVLVLRIREILIDPNKMEKRKLHKKPVISYHYIPSYMQALRSYVEFYFSDAGVEDVHFWNIPEITDEIRELFAAEGKYDIESGKA